MDYRCLRKLFSSLKINHAYRFYSRNISRRQTVRILHSPQDPITDIQQDNTKPKWHHDNQTNDSLNSVISERGTSSTVPQFEMIKKTDSLFTKTLSLVQSRKLRERKGKMFLEGKRLINDAIDAGLKLHVVYFCHEDELTEINCQAGQKVRFFKVVNRTMQLLSSNTNPLGVIGVFNRPSADDIKLLSKPVLPVTILCDNIRDPGNLGSIIRHAASAGCENVLLMKGCVDPWETKVLKVGCGGHFRIPIKNNIDWTNIPDHLPKQPKIFIADNSSDIEYWEHTPDLISYDTSLKQIEDGSAGEGNKYINEQDELVQADKSNKTDTFEDMDLPCYLYSSVLFPRENVVLYVGGETHGVDERIVKLAANYDGKRVKIPLENSMDSLNSSFAMAIILYEIKRQLSENF